MEPGLSNAFKVFKKSAKQVPAYRAFLKQKHFNSALVQVPKEFTKIPVSTKENYIVHSRISQRLANDSQTPFSAYASSGSSGQPTFWLKGSKEEDLSGEIHTKILTDVFEIKKDEPTLAVICFSMGVWIAGNFTAAAFKYAAKQGFNITTITPGYEKEDVLKTIKLLSHEYKHLILAGHPPFVMDVLTEAKKRKISLPQSVRIFTAGDKFTESWRTEALKRIGQRNAAFVTNLYGSTDAGVMGYETPLSIFIRRSLPEQSILHKEVFGKGASQPALFQYDPEHIFFENIDGKLVLTRDAAIPLVRYDIHDEGRIIPWETMHAELTRHGLLAKAKAHGLFKWKLPFIVKGGRSDVAVTFYAMNIYPEHLKSGIEDKTINKNLTGSYFVYNKNSKDQKKQQLFLELELKGKLKPNPKLKERILKTFVRKLEKISLEYKKLYSSIGKRALPNLVLVPAGRLSQKSRGGMLYINGKKPRILS